jgi:prepilin-type N-terminal cleavage/methylation domain-containing protein
MIPHKFELFNRNQRGFTLIEMLVVVAITGLIALGASIASVQVINQSTSNTDYTAASRDTLNAINWVSLDTQMAQTIQTDGAAGFPLTLHWLDWDNKAYEVIYSLEDSKLKRSYSVNGSGPRVIYVAEYINTDTQMTNCASDNGVLTLKVTSSVGEGRQTCSVTKVREISSRPSL